VREAATGKARLPTVESLVYLVRKLLFTLQ